MPMTAKQVKAHFDNMTPEEKDQITQDMQRSWQRLLDQVAKLAKEGKGLEWDPDVGTLVICDTPGLNARYQQEVETPEQPAKRKILPDVPNVMHDDRLTVLSNHVIYAANASFHSAQSNFDVDWHRGERIPTFMYQKDGGTVFIELRPQGKSPDDDSLLSSSELAPVWAILTGQGSERRVTSLSGIVLHTLVAHAIRSAPDASGNRWITAEQILAYRNRQKVTKATDGGERRTAGHRTEDIEEIGAVMKQLNNTWVQLHVKIVDDTDSRGRKRRTEYTHHSRIIAVTGTITQKEITPESTSTMPVAWAFALGTWAEPFLTGSNRFTAELLQQCLAYDPYHEMWELRLADYFTLAMRTNASHGATVRIQIGKLLNELSLPIDNDHPKETRRNFERAMDRICNERAISASWRYKDGEPTLKRYKWLADWLGLDVDVTPSNDTRQQYRKIAERSEMRRQRAEAFEAAKQAKQKMGKGE